jgi:hypothetical protein
VAASASSEKTHCLEFEVLGGKMRSLDHLLQLSWSGLTLKLETPVEMVILTQRRWMLSAHGRHEPVESLGLLGQPSNVSQYASLVL